MCRFPIPEREIIRNRGDLTAPYRTPALIGCATAIDREFFFEIGTFDTGMNIWGGEATELSIRVRKFYLKNSIQNVEFMKIFNVIKK